MNEATPIRREDPSLASPKKGGMTAAEARYMRGDSQPATGSMPISTSKYLNSPLFVHAYGTMALRRLGPDVPCTFDIPNMSRALDDVADYAEAAELIAIEKAQNPEFAAWLDRRRITYYNPAEMDHHADGTLGATIRDFMTRSGFTLDFVHQDVEVRTDLEYALKRTGQCHDIQHMATGFGPNLAGEHALALMNLTCNAEYFGPELAGYFSMPNLFVSSAHFMRTCLHYRPSVPDLLEATVLGIEAGRAVRKPLMLIEWEDYLDWQLEDITADLGFRRGPGDAWAYTDETMQG